MDGQESDPFKADQALPPTTAPRERGRSGSSTSGRPKKKKGRGRKEPAEEDTVYVTLYEDEEPKETSNPALDPSYPPETSRTKSQLGEKVSRIYDPQDINFIKSKGITLEELLSPWTLYFWESPPQFSAKSPRQRMALALLASLLRDYQASKLSYLCWQPRKGDPTIQALLSLGTLCDSDSAAKERLQTYRLFLEECPEEFIASFGLALHCFRTRILQKNNERVNVCLSSKNNFLNITSFTRLSSSMINRFVVIKGRIISLLTPRILTRSASFSCEECGRTFKKAFPDGLFSPPSRCEDPACLCKCFLWIRQKQKFLFFNDSSFRKSLLPKQSQALEAKDLWTYSRVKPLNLWLDSSSSTK